MPQNIGKENGKISLRHGGTLAEALFHTFLDGSLTLEAALSLPMFLFAVGMALYLFVMLQVQYAVGEALDRAVAETALLREVSVGKVENLVKASFYKELAGQKGSLSKIELGVAGFSWKGTKVGGSHIQAQVSYQVKFPFGYFGKRRLKFSNQCKMRRWTGFQEGGGGSVMQEWVYITPAQTVYHTRRSCTHLKLSVKSVSSANLKALKKYGACGHCAKGEGRGAVVYLTEEGDCYHYKIHCSGLKRTVYMVRKEEAGGRPPCSRCGGM